MSLNHARSVRLRFGTVVLASAILTAGFGAPVATAESSPVAANGVVPEASLTAGMSASDAASVFSVAAWDTSEIAAINPKVLKLALAASQCAMRSGDVRNPTTLTVIDYSKPSTEPRLWVLDLEARDVLYEELVAHGQGSGANLATKFSNAPDSHQTSIGLFRTDTTYVGRNGYSLRLDGLDKGFNDRARERAIVMHGAPYVNPEITKTLGRLGRSHGCPAVRNAVAHELIDRVKGGGLVFAYYPDRDWLNESRYLNACS